MSDTKHRLSLSIGAGSSPRRRKPLEFRRTSREAAASTSDFDPAAWFAIVEEQKLAIARAAGVDPSKIRIQIGH